jgi:hypothetical protein
MKQRLLTIALTISATAAHAQLPLTQPKCVIPQSSMVSWWTGDTNENDLYGANNPSAVDAVTLVPAEVLDGFTFGTDGYIDIPASASLANQKFTWTMWAEPNGPGPNPDRFGSAIVGQEVDNGVDAPLEFTWTEQGEPVNEGQFLFIFGNSGSEVIQSSQSYPIGAFYFIVGTYDGETFRLYVDGVLAGSYAEKKTVAYSTTTWTIGSANAYYRGSGFPRTWDGIIDEVQAYKTALSAAEILRIYNTKSAGVCKAAVLANPDSEAFASEPVGTESPAKTISIINNRDVVLTLDGFSFSGADPLDFAQSATTCSDTLKARASCRVSLTFTPQATGKRTATFDIKDSDASSPQSVSLTGTGESD